MSQGYTKVEYNGIELIDCQTLKFEQQPIHDSSGQVHVFEKYTVRVTGYFLAQYYSSLAIRPQKTSNLSAGEHYVDLRERLTARRKPFKMTLGFSGPNPQVILEAKSLGLESTTGDPEDVTTLTDVNNGPIPQVISVQHIASNTAIRVEWEVTIHLLPKCEQSGGSASEGSDQATQRQYGVLSNRWSCSDDLDENYWTTRTWQGELKLAHPCRNPHDFRGLCIPEIQPGMRRGKMHFTATEDGLSLRYNVTDSEVYMTAPAPAHSIVYSQREIIAENVVNIRTIFSVRVAGDRLASKRELLILAMAVADAKLRIKERVPPAGVDAKRPVRLLGYELFEESGTAAENAVTVSVQLLHAMHADQQQVNFLMLKRVDAEFGTKLDGTMIQNYINTLSQGNRPGESPVPYGPIPMVGAFAAFLQSPCTDDKSTNAGLPVNERWYKIVGDTAKELVGSDKLPDVSGTIVPRLEDTDDFTFSESYRSAIYQTFQIDSGYKETTLIAQMPVALPGVTVSASPSGSTPEPSGSGEDSGSGSGNPMPVSGSSSSSTSGSTSQPNSVFIRLGPTQYQRTISVVAERHGKPPKLSDPLDAFIDSDGITNVKLAGAWMGYEPARSADGESRNYVMRGEWVYGLSGKPKSMRFGAPDYDSYESSGETSPKYKFALTEIFSSHQAIG